jgi:hypothetical protein
MIPLAAIASRNAATAQAAALSTRELAIGIAEIDSTAYGLREQAESLAPDRASGRKQTVTAGVVSAMASIAESVDAIFWKTHQCVTCALVSK